LNPASPPNTTTLATSLGHRITAFQGDHIADKIACHGLYEKDVLEFLLALLKLLPQPVVLDIGANIGNHTLAFATVAAQVHAFEPIPAIYALLDQNVAQNQLHNVVVHNFALSDTAGSDLIYMVQTGNVGASSFDKRAKGGEPVIVQKRRGDEVEAIQKLQQLDLVKIDVEAHEVFVLRGLMQTLRKFLPIITMEWNDPLTVKRLNGSAELQFLYDNYHIVVLGCNHDRVWWQGRPLAFVRRKFTRHLLPRSAVLYPFDPAKLYDNLLLIPKGRESLLTQLHTPQRS
jgi:FkbM family methyltransferase